jgi:hypothetical protein
LLFVLLVSSAIWQTSASSVLLPRAAPGWVDTTAAQQQRVSGGSKRLTTFDDVVADLMGHRQQELPSYLNRRSMVESSPNASADRNRVGIRPKIYIYNLSATWRDNKEAYIHIFKGLYGMEMVSCAELCSFSLLALLHVPELTQVLRHTTDPCTCLHSAVHVPHHHRLIVVSYSCSASFWRYIAIWVILTFVGGGIWRYERFYGARRAICYLSPEWRWQTGVCLRV